VECYDRWGEFQKGGKEILGERKKGISEGRKEFNEWQKLNIFIDIEEGKNYVKEGKRNGMKEGMRNLYGYDLNKRCIFKFKLK